MVRRSRQIILLVLLGAGSCLAPVVAGAQQNNQFFESNTVDDFTVPVVDKQGIGFQYFIDTESKKKKIEEELKAETPAPLPSAAIKDQSATNQPNPFTSGQDVLSTFGDPAKDAPVLAQENAPKPFKAMMAAFEVGDDQLAYGYARQWVRYMGNLQKRTSRVVEAANAAQASERVVSGSGADGDRIKQMIVSDNGNLAANLDPRAQKILAQAESDEAATQAAPENDQEQQELKAREVIRKQITGRVPVDPRGRVDVYLFFAPNDPVAKNFAPVANQIFRRVSLMKNVNFAAFSTARLNSDALKRERAKLGLSFNLMVGDAFAKELKLSKFPAVIFSAPSSAKILRETGDKQFIFYDELIAAMQGRVQ